MPSKTQSGTQSQKKQQLLRKAATPSSELELYIHLLVLLHLIDEKKYKEALACAK